MTLIDLFRDFNKEATTKSYPSSARNLFHTLMWIWNERRRPTEVSLPRQAIIALTGLPDSTFRDAFSFLSSRGWVKRLNSRNRATYTFRMCTDRANSATDARFPMDACAEPNDERKEKFSSKKIFPSVPNEQEDDLNDISERKNDSSERTLEEALFAE